ncbi:MAG TPA: DUF1062 domain-containing protein [Myxococcota bacterium]|nr:DUF1062 domain-containing protein [Myxococcota bacterium]
MLSPTTVWRVEALALPALSLRCARCARVSSFHTTERFRVNANGGRLDVWLLYCCERCAELHKQRIERRVRASALAPEVLAGYQVDAPELVRRCAFGAGGGAEVAYRVVRDPLSESGVLRARIEQPEPCGVRWDRLLARELGGSRSGVARAADRGALRINGANDVRRTVADGDLVEADAVVSARAGTARRADA